MHIIDVIRNSLDAILELEYPCFELIIVDNGSADGSEKAIEKHIDSKVRDGPKVRFIRLDKNCGFAGGNNFAFAARDRESKYAALINNDAIPRSNYLTNLVEFLEKHEDVGVVQGVIVKLGNSIIDSAGFLADEALNLYPISRGKRSFGFSNAVQVSCVEGTMAVYRIDAIRRSMNDDNIMFIKNAFMYYLEDLFLSLLLWNHGFGCVVLPVVTGEHLRMGTINRYSECVGLPYYSLRNHIALLYITNSITRRRTILKQIRLLLVSKRSLVKRRMILTALAAGINLGKQLGEKYGLMDIYKAPILRQSIRRRLTI